jgi:membrane-bound lytic murein transglycosylase D
MSETPRCGKRKRDTFQPQAVALQVFDRRSMSSRRAANSIFAASVLTLAGVLLFALAGCEQSAQKAVKAQVPEVTAKSPALEQLPLDSRRENLPALASLTPPPKPYAEAVIEAAEGAFRAGEQSYRAGHLEKARREFDHAVDTLLLSGLDLNANPRLAPLFDRIVSTVHAYELAAYREGDGFTPQRAEPAPLDEIAELTFPTDPRLREKAEAELATVPHDLPLTINDQVLSYLNFFQTPRGRAIVEHGLRRAGRYREMIARILREEGLPQDLIYLAQAESAFQPLALSRAGARGIWQFMAYRGREYGLYRTWWVDDRQNPEKSTRAAARHLRDLYEVFGDWYLVLAAYNSGPGTVQRAVERTGYADFWELHKRSVLPRETKNYVPIILALTLITKDPALYGISVEADAPLRTDRIKPGHPIDLRLVAETIDVPLEDLKLLNPHLLRMTTPNDPEFELHLPEGTAERFFAETAAVPPEKWVLWRRHRVEPGETLSAVAKKYRITAEAIAAVNNFAASAELQIGEKLIIPATTPPGSERGKLVRYRVRRGDTLATISEQFDVTVSELKRWNGLRGERVARGTVLKVYPGGRPSAQPAQAAAKAKSTQERTTTAALTTNSEPVIHKVRPGETLWSIARAYQTTVEALRAANRFLVSRQLQAGDQLMILPPR